MFLRSREHFATGVIDAKAAISALEKENRCEADIMYVQMKIHALKRIGSTMLDGGPLPPLISRIAFYFNNLKRADELRRHLVR